MKQIDDLERTLRDMPVADPPENLEDRLIADIPSEFPSAGGGSVSTGSGRRFQWQMAAAAVLVLALTGVVTWKMSPLGLKERSSTFPVAHDQAVLRSIDEHPEAAAAGQLRTGARRKVASTPAAKREKVKSSSGSASRAAAVALAPTDASDASKRPAGAVIQPGGAPDGKTRSARLEEKEHPVAVSHPGDRPTASGKAPVSQNSRKEMAEKLPPVFEEKGPLTARAPVADVTSMTIEAPRNEPVHPSTAAVLGSRTGRPGRESEVIRPVPSTGGTTEPNDRPYGNVYFEPTGVNPFVDTEDDPLSTFGLDVDTGSYTVTRRYLRDGHLPPPAAIRVEEFVNAFDYGDPAPHRRDFNLEAEGAPDPFGDRERSFILRFAVTARQVDTEQRPPAVLIFTVDVSGSMARENRLGLVKRALTMLLDELRPDDRVGLVVFGSSGRVLLEPTSDHRAIRAAIRRLVPGGSTNAEEGLVLAYRMADRFRDEFGEPGEGQRPIVRIILCSDGVANVGHTGASSILRRIRQEAGRGVELTTVGFGMGNYNDTLMERLADMGNGCYAYVDDLEEARRIFVEELTGTLLTVAHDARSQVEFNPGVVERWRLMGYENRDIADERFRDPAVDAGEVGAGQTVTVLYEVKLRPRVPTHRVVATLRLRYRPTGEQEFVELHRVLHVSDLARSWEEASPRLKLATLVAEFAEILKHSYWARHDDLGEVLRRLQQLHGPLARREEVEELRSLVREALRIQRNERFATGE